MTWAEVRREFEVLVELLPPEREAHLRATESTDPELARQLRDLLAHDEAATGFLERSGPMPSAISAVEPAAGLEFGSYRLVRPLGTGGMGAVWLATGGNPSRDVALKILSSGPLSRSERWRFQYETEVLAQLQHPAIAQLYEAGSQPFEGGDVAWFAMELVDEARDIIAWADHASLSLAQRLALFGELCSAVRYGHRRGVVHRDIKPANVLVDCEGRLKLIDFGVARAVGGERPTPSLRTRQGEVVGTLQYMAPEQVAGRVDEIDVRSDVYALGVVLYRLLVGAPPFDFSEVSLAETARVVCEEEPARPSSVRPELSKDLDAILLEALAKKPERRYQSVAELTEDLRRFAAHEPVQARPPSGFYYAAKYVRRNLAAVAVTVAVLLGLTIAAAGLVSGIRQARAGEKTARDAAEESKRQEGLALRAAERSQVALGLVEGLFEGIQDTVDGRQVKVADLLDASVLRSGVIEDPGVEFTVRAVRGRIYYRLKQYESARDELERAVALYPQSQQDAADRERDVAVRATLGDVLRYTGDADRGEAMIREALADARSERLPNVQTYALSLLCVYLHEQGDFDELLERARELRTLGAKGETEWLGTSNMVALGLQGGRAPRRGRRAVRGDLGGPQAPG